ncbi:ricin-type beta-trefoil lectin domain protein [Actinoplanes sp. NEAU-A12]|uniref:Ricin-type beta-trefoil lectin domain protein n=1 Tax=Actinoplanes sandaracinus TaxID=3045177 RepID=A0ABT6WTT2_9ACTN|nr:ricin-type beta-trefoil lectin domain protein [Actinoplanes sandaracinus]MDI6103025.1 ricin-type beta-trefoil lectin domain protein [Actinoplanes sandaracinus]
MGTGLAAGTPAQAIAGSGAAPDGSYRFAARIDVSGMRACSGALVAPQWIVTATACFAEDGKPVTAGAPPRAATVSVGHGTSAATKTTVTTLVPHAGRNVVLAKLNTWIAGIDPVAVGTTAPAAGDVVRAAGYGRTASEWVPDKLHTATFEVKAARAGALDLTRKDAAAGICKGDAGGPLLREAGDRVELVAIHHTAEQKGCLGSSDTGQDAVETRLDDLGDWLAQTRPDALHGSVRFGRVTGVAGKCLDIPNSATADGTRVTVYDCNGSGAQDVTTPGDGTLRVFGKCIDAGGPATGSIPGDRYLHLWSCNGTPAQQWQQRPNGTLYQVNNDRCIDTPTSSNGARLYLHACHGGDNQKWAIPAFSGARFGKVTGVGGKCVDIPNGRNPNGAMVTLYACNSTYAQDVTLPGDGTLRLVGKCVDAGGPAVGPDVSLYPQRLVHLWSCNGTAPQLWRLNSDGTLYSNLSGPNASCLDTPNTNNGTQLYIHRCNGGPHQQWKLP